MIQEYLFSDKTHRAEVSNYKPANVECEIIDFENSDCWMATYSVPHEDENAAKILSAINEYVVQNYTPTVLSNESAAYFNKTLFPLINVFERKLRKLLYLKSALNKDEKTAENIKDLEEKDLGKIFEFLFTDESFTKEVRSKIKTEMTWQFAKKELFCILDSIKETTLWDTLIGVNAVPALRENYLDAKSFRNDIMHAHNISYAAFKDARSLFQKINIQLDTEVGLVISAAEKQPTPATTSSYNAALGEALMRANFQDALSQLVQQMSTINADIAPAVSLLNEMYKSLADATQISKPVLDAISKSLQPSPEMIKLREVFESMKPLTLPQETLDAFKKASEFYHKQLPRNEGTEASDKENEESTT